ncbi:MAG: hypothetical protein O7G85_05475 [Planctomycetota bacterium]|nr:hypothetical protein [Planctomycetota bacterium]
MRIGSNLPFHVAKAYGVQPPTKPSIAQPATASTPIQATQPVEKATPGESLQGLIGGQVPGRVDFDAASSIQQPAGPVLQLYTRAADKVEAATSVSLGRSLDLKG